MEIQYLGHACFRISSEQATVVCDPFDKSMVGFGMSPTTCDVVTVSHSHGDHSCLDSIKGKPIVLDKELTYETGDLTIASLPTYHDEVRGAKRGPNLVFTFESCGIKVAHMGDVGCLDEQLANQLQGCDVLLIPVGGNYTIDAVGAKWYVDHIKPKLVVPMHYRSEMHTLDIDGIDKFTQLFGKGEVEFAKSHTLTLSQMSVGSRPHVVVLERCAN